MSRIRRLVVLLTVVLAAAVAVAQEKPRLAIASFGNPKEFPNSGIAETLTGQLRTGLAATGRYQIVQGMGTGLDVVEAEQGLAKSGKTQAVSSPRSGQLTGVHYLLTGSVTEFSYKENKITESGANRVAAGTAELLIQTATVRLDFQLVDATTRIQVFAATGVGRATAQSATSQMAVYNRMVAVQGNVVTELKDSLMGRAADQAVRDLVRRLSDGSNVARQALTDAAGAAERERLSSAEGEILAELSDGQFVVSLGRDAGMVVGTNLAVANEVISRDKTGKEVYREKVAVGVLRITDVSMRDRAKAERVAVAAAGRPPRVGDRVAPDLGAVRPTTAAGAAAAPTTTRAAAPGIAAERRAGGPGDDHVRQADRFFEDGLFAEAADQYQRAMAAEGESAPLLQRLSHTQFLTRDFLEGEKTAERIIAAGHLYGIPMIHRHGLGRCLGDLKIGPGKLIYQPTTGDHLATLTPAQIAAFAEVSAAGFGAKMKVPALEITWRGPGGDEEKTTLMPTIYAKVDTRIFVMEPKDIEDTLKLSHVVKRLVTRYVLPESTR